MALKFKCNNIYEVEELLEKSTGKKPKRNKIYQACKQGKKYFGFEFTELRVGDDDVFVKASNIKIRKTHKRQSKKVIKINNQLDLFEDYLKRKEHGSRNS